MPTRVQCLVVRDDRVLMVSHRQDGKQWWCLPGGRQECGEAAPDGALRELWEECAIRSTVIRQTAHAWSAPPDKVRDQTLTFLVEIGDQEAVLGHDPDLAPDRQVLDDVQWLRLSEIPERDRVFLWAAGLLGIGDFLAEVERWGDQVCLPGQCRPA